METNNKTDTDRQSLQMLIKTAINKQPLNSIWDDRIPTYNISRENMYSIILFKSQRLIMLSK